MTAVRPHAATPRLAAPALAPAPASRPPVARGGLAATPRLASAPGARRRFRSGLAAPGHARVPTSPTPPRHRASAFPPEGLEWIPTPETVFDFENVAIFPFWLGMIAFPNAPPTKLVMGSYAVPILCGLAYVYLTYYSFSDPRIVEAFSTGKPDLASLANGFSYEWCMAVGWAHFIAMDLFVGRWIYLDARKNDVFAAHSLLLCLFFGPTGVMSHVVTRTVTGWTRGEKIEDIMAAGGKAGSGGEAETSR
jgi:hypothetical protein